MSNFIITQHAKERYIERIGQSGGTLSLREAHHILLSAMLKATKLKRKTHKGELLYSNPEIDTVFVVKPESGKLWVVTVLSGSQHAEWEAQIDIEIEEARNLLTPLPEEVKPNPSTYLTHLESVIHRLKEANKKLSLEIDYLREEIKSLTSLKPSNRNRHPKGDNHKCRATRF